MDNESIDGESIDDENMDDESIEELESDSDIESNIESDNESVLESDLDSDNNESEMDNIKVIKLNVSNDNEINDSSINDEIEDLVEIDDLESVNNLADNHNNSVNKILDLKYNDNEIFNLEKEIPTNNLKTISINLGDEETNKKENIDYKKLQITKLRSIIVEKGLTSNAEASKLKKNEILKLLGAE
jgi:hypothetical protein